MIRGFRRCIVTPIGLTKNTKVGDYGIVSQTKRSHNYERFENLFIEASQREALRAVLKKFDALGTIPEAKREALLSELDEVFRDSQTDALADTLDYWAIEMRSTLEESS